jgi:hypothetical protein
LASEPRRRHPVDEEVRFNELWIEAEHLRLEGIAPKEIAQRLNKSESMISQYTRKLANAAESIKWAYERLADTRDRASGRAHSRPSFYERKAREKLSFKSMSDMAHRAKWDALRQGRWLYDKGALYLCYQLGQNHRIEVDRTRSTALLAALEEVLAGVAISVAAAKHGFNAYSLRKIIKHSEFYQGKIKVPDAQGKAFQWETGRHPVIIQKDLAGRLARRPKTMFRVPLAKIREIFEIRRTQLRSGNTSLKEIGEKIVVPWQTVDALLRNPNCKQVVGDKLWKEASPLATDELAHGRPRGQRSTV